MTRVMFVDAEPPRWSTLRPKCRPRHQPETEILASAPHLRPQFWLREAADREETCVWPRGRGWSGELSIWREWNLSGRPDRRGRRTKRRRDVGRPGQNTGSAQRQRSKASRGQGHQRCASYSQRSKASRGQGHQRCATYSQRSKASRGQGHRVVRPTLSGQRPAKVKVTGVHRVVRPTTPSPPTLGVVSRVQYIELSADMSLGYGNGSDSPHRTRLKTCRSARVMVATARIANITCRILSFRCLSVPHVGSRAHVKVASRIVRRSVDQLTCRSATEWR